MRRADDDVRKDAELGASRIGAPIFLLRRRDKISIRDVLFPKNSAAVTLKPPNKPADRECVVIG